MRRFLFLAFLLPLISMSSGTAFAVDAKYAEGQHYLLVAKPVPAADPHKITVEEFFWFGCPHCYELEPDLEVWRKKLPADADFSFVPNSLGRPEGVIHEQAFYIAQSLGIEDRIHQPLFEALVRDRLPLVTLPSIREFFVHTAQIKPGDFDALAGSFMIDGDVRRADQAARDYQVLGTPTLVIGGKYVTTFGLPGFAGKKTVEAANEELLDIASFLIAKVRAERGLAK